MKDVTEFAKKHGILPPLEVNTKETNPKDSVGIKKVPVSTIPGPVLMEIGLGLMEGALKYGRHNYRVAGVRASVYIDATSRHLFDWWEGTDIDPDSGLSHVTKAIASLVVLRDAMIQGKLNDDRPPKSPDGWMQELNKAAEIILYKYPDPKPAHTQTENHEQERTEEPGIYQGISTDTRRSEEKGIEYVSPRHIDFGNPRGITKHEYDVDSRS